MMLNLFTIPNILTLFNLLLGCAAAAFASMGRMEAAVGCIAAAAVCDFADGLAARIFNAHSAVGRQLDSLADVISFGFAPAFMLFVAISANEGGYEGRMPFYFFMLFPFLLTAFSALRLAKFNIDERQSVSFRGLPTPANGLFFAVVALLYWRRELPAMPSVWDFVWLTAVFSFLLVCELPMFSLKIKGWQPRKYWVQYVFLVIALILLLLWRTAGIPAIIIVYIVMSVILSIFNKFNPN